MTFDASNHEALYKMHEWQPKVLNGAGHDKKAALLNTISGSSFAGREIVPRPWLIKDWIPGQVVALLYGDGGTGKSLAALQLAVAVVTGSDWIGTMPEQQGPVLYLSAEDDADEIHRRLADIVEAQGRSLEELDDLHIVDLAARDAVLAVPSKSGGIEATALWSAVRAKIEELRPVLVIVDTQADVFAGNEIARAEVRQFMTLLRGAGRDFEMTVLVLAHPSVTGINSGTGTSGSTAWSNSSRGRLYLQRIKAGESDEEPDPDLRVLRLMKSNSARIGTEIRVRWVRGCFKPENGGSSGFDRAAKEAGADRAFIELLREYRRQDRDVSPQPSRTYAPMVFSKEPDGKAFGKRELEQSMGRLLKNGQIEVEKHGPPSHRRSRLIVSD